MTILELLIHCNNHDEYECPKIIKWQGIIFHRNECANSAGDYYFYEDEDYDNLIQYIDYNNDLRETFEIIKPAIEVQERKEIESIDTFYDNIIDEDVAKTNVHEIDYTVIINSPFDEMIIMKLNEVIESVNELK